MSTLEDVVVQVRMYTPKPKQQSLDAWLKDTYAQALVIWQASHPALPRVQAQQARSAKLKALKGEPEKETEDE